MTSNHCWEIVLSQESIMENTSGHGKMAIVPAEIDGWSWPAFLLNWIWGIGNNTFIALLIFVPFVNVIMPFVLGVKGNAWAWKNKEWESVEHFKTVQKKWTRWTVIIYLFIVLVFGGIFFITMTLIKDSDAFKLAQSQFESSQQASDIIGKPFSTGFPSGNVESSESSGKAAVSFGVEGTKGKGTVYFDAVKELGQWKINSLVLQEEVTGKRTDIMPMSVQEVITPVLIETSVVIAPAAATEAKVNQAGVRKPKGNAEEFWSDFTWDELSAEEKKLWAVLGWNGRIWGSETESPASDGTSWNKLNKEEQTALTSLGYSEKVWNKE
jgi:hypothetical protein